MKLMLSLAFAAVLSANLLADDAQPGGKDPNAEPAAAAPAEPAKPVRHVKKLVEYTSLTDAIKAAEDWQQPIVVYVSLQGDPLGGRIRNAVITRELQKEFFQRNCVFASIKVPQWEDPDKKNRRTRQKTTPKPDYTRLTGDNSVCAQVALGMTGTDNPERNPTMPQLAVLTPNGRKRLGANVYTEGMADITLKETVDMLKGACLAGKFECEISPKLQKLLDKEAKARAKAAKRK